MTCRLFKHPDLDLYEVELTRGNQIRMMELWCTSASEAKDQARANNRGFEVTGCREVEQ